MGQQGRMSGQATFGLPLRGGRTISTLGIAPLIKNTR